MTNARHETDQARALAADVGPAGRTQSETQPSHDGTDREWTHLHDDSGFRALLAEATADPAVEGLILTGSMAAGTGTPWSDYDVRLIVRDDASEEVVQRYADAMYPLVDLVILTHSEFAVYARWASPEAWDRPTFTHAQVLLDHSGTIQPLVDAKGRLPADQQAAFAAAMLDAFINGVYRALKCQRKGNTLCTRLEATEAVSYALHVLFAWEGRLKPYPGWLEYELQATPSTTLPLASNELLCWLTRIVAEGDVAALQALFATILEVAQERGHDDVIVSWGEAIAWMQASTTQRAG